MTCVEVVHNDVIMLLPWKVGHVVLDPRDTDDTPPLQIVVKTDDERLHFRDVLLVLCTHCKMCVSHDVMHWIFTHHTIVLEYCTPPVIDFVRSIVPSHDVEKIMVVAKYMDDGNYDWVKNINCKHMLQHLCKHPECMEQLNPLFVKCVVSCTGDISYNHCQRCDPIAAFIRDGEYVELNPDSYMLLTEFRSLYDIHRTHPGYRTRRYISDFSYKAAFETLGLTVTHEADILYNGVVHNDVHVVYGIGPV